jgi:hypothetical protein
MMPDPMRFIHQLLRESLERSLNRNSFGIRLDHYAEIASK